MRARSQLRDDRGIALVLTLAVMFVLAIVIAAMLQHMATNARSSHQSKADESAFSLAEAGVNNAMGVIGQATNPADPSLLATPRITTFERGYASWSGTYDADPTVRSWTITSTGAMPNPTGAGDITRTITVVVPLVPAASQPLTNDSWNYVFTTRDGPGCDLVLDNSVDFNTRLYVVGRLCLDNGATVTNGPVYVGRGVDLFKSNNRIGSSSASITTMFSGEGCSLQGGTRHQPCTTADHVWYGSWASAMPTLTAPVADWASRYQDSAPGPSHPCTSGTLPSTTFDNDGSFNPSSFPNGSVTTVFDLAPRGASYECRTSAAGLPSGELSWNHVTRKLTIAGTVFIDGSMVASAAGQNPKSIDYDGKGSIYLSGTMLFEGNTNVCGKVASDDCDRRAPADGGWNPNEELLLIAANGSSSAGSGWTAGDSMLLQNSAHFQGALYATNYIEMQNSAEVQGPMFGTTLYTGNSAQAYSFPVIDSVPVGTPGNTITAFALGKPERFKG